MKGGAGVSAADFRTDYRGGSKAAQDRNEIWTYHVVRPLSFYLAAAFVRAGITANQVTWLSFVVLIAGCLLVGFGSYPAALLGAALINAWLLLDCTDGNIARFRRTSSTYGAFLDTIGGYAAYALVFLAAGIGAYHRPDDVWLRTVWGDGTGVDGAVWALLGAWASIAALWTRLVFQKFKNSFGGPEARRHQLLDAPSGPSWVRGLMGAGNNLLNVSGGRGPGAPVAGHPDRGARPVPGARRARQHGRARAHLRVADPPGRQRRQLDPGAFAQFLRPRPFATRPEGATVSRPLISLQEA